MEEEFMGNGNTTNYSIFDFYDVIIYIQNESIAFFAWNLTSES